MERPMGFKRWLLLGIVAAGGIPPADLPATATEDIAAPRVVARAAGFCPGSIRWQVAENYVGQRRSVRGPVKSTVYARQSSGRPTFLNVGRPFPNQQRFTVVIWGRSRRHFPQPPEHLYRGEYICVTGRIRLFEGLPQTFASSPGAIDIRGEFGTKLGADLRLRRRCFGQRPATITGTSAGETLVGTSGDDVILGLGGSDVIMGRAGRDRICGGDGDDDISAGPDHDIAGGDDGSDLISGGIDRDDLWGDALEDILKGGRGADWLFGGPGEDTTAGGAGHDDCSGERLVTCEDPF
jgi:hypothetical protein